MVEREFLGWDRPFVTCAVDWLLERGETLPRLLVVVPTAQAGRHLRDALAERAGALLAPCLITSGSLLQTPGPEVAADWMERVAWVETLESVTEWELYQELFPQAPAAHGAWANDLAIELLRLRHVLQENGLALSSAARLLGRSVEAGRWEALARLEQLMEQKLRSWGAQSRSRVLAGGVVLPDVHAGIVLAGVTDMPPLLERAFDQWPGTVSVLIAAPPEESEAFSALGRPLGCWAQRTMPWPEHRAGSVRLVADARQQATEAWRAISTAGTPSNEVAVGSADREAGDELARVLTRHGWPAFHPAADPGLGGLARWMKVWSEWLEDPQLATMADLLAMPATSMLVPCRRAECAMALSRVRNDWMVQRADDLRHRCLTASFRSDHHRQSTETVLQAVSLLESKRHDFLQGDFPTAMGSLLEALSGFDDAMAEECEIMGVLLEGAASLMRRVVRGAGFWTELLISEIPSPFPQAPEGRVVDVQGWLELLFEAGPHLLLCGMNEGKVPAGNAGDPWLGEAACQLLGLTTHAERAARDAFLYQTMLEARRHGGRVDVICVKTGTAGEAMLPSRFLLAAPRDDLAERVKFLFRGIEPPESGMRWHADWQWQARSAEAPKQISATSLSTYLACPFRYYLKHLLRMQHPSPERVEWNARDFGNVTHDLMERWGRDAQARNLTQAEPLHAWLTAELDRILDEHFGPHLPLSVRVQSAALRQRLVWFARIQSASRADGWETIEVEHAIEIPFGAASVVARIDRIDRHREHGALRVIDYKTGKVEDVAKAHRQKITASTVLPAHLSDDSPAVYTGLDRQKPADFLWRNLQLPLYALALHKQHGSLPSPCYFNLGATEADVGLHAWQGFSDTDLDAANACTAWLIDRITTGIFWPPAEKIRYDDFAEMTGGRPLVEQFSPPAPLTPAG